MSAQAKEWVAKSEDAEEAAEEARVAAEKVRRAMEMAQVDAEEAAAAHSRAVLRLTEATKTREGADA